MHSKLEFLILTISTAIAFGYLYMIQFVPATLQFIPATFKWLEYLQAQPIFSNLTLEYGINPVHRCDVRMPNFTVYHLKASLPL